MTTCNNNNNNNNNPTIHHNVPTNRHQKHTQNIDQRQSTILQKPNLKGYLFSQLVGKGTYGYVFKATKCVNI